MLILVICNRSPILFFPALWGRGGGGGSLCPFPDGITAMLFLGLLGKCKVPMTDFDILSTSGSHWASFSTSLSICATMDKCCYRIASSEGFGGTAVFFWKLTNLTTVNHTLPLPMLTINFSVFCFQASSHTFFPL